MLSDLAGALVNGIRIEPFDRIGDARMHSLSAWGRDTGKQRLTDKFMSKGKPSLRPFGAWDDYPHLLRLLDDGKEFVNVELAHRSQELKAETTSEHRCSRKRTILILAEPLPPAHDD